MKASTAKYLFDILLIFLTGSTGTHRKNQPAAFFTSTERLFFACLSNIARTQMQAMQMSFFILLPSILLSGFMFPRAAMPRIIQYIGDLIPLTYYLLIIRGIVLKVIGFAYLVPQVITLLVFTLLLLTLSIARFKKKLLKW